MKDLLRLKEHNTTIKTEVLAGLTTFFTMAYIIFVNPAILSQTGMDFNSVLVATCLASAVGTLLIGLLSNYPFALAPGMGLNAYFAFTVVGGMGYTWQEALAAVFISGVIFILLTVSGLREHLVKALPLPIRFSIPAGIGLFIAFIGFNNAGIVRVNQAPVLDIIRNNWESGSLNQLLRAVGEAPPQILEMGNLADKGVLLAFFGLVVTGILLARQVKGALFLGILLTTLLGIPLGITSIPQEFAFNSISLQPTFFKPDFAGLLQADQGIGLAGLIAGFVTVILSFTLVDMFDTIGALLGTAARGGFLDEQGNLPRMKRSMLADAIATTFGALVGTSTVTTYIESGAGIMEGGKTGLVSVVVALFFLLAIFFAPIAGVIPIQATAPALILIGFMMLSSLKRIDFEKVEEGIPAFIMLTLMPFTYSIANGIAGGLFFYLVLMLFTGKYKKIHPLVYLVTLLFILHFMIA
jgi:AGZA family xanthine/uracil permease-like MFS transporter